MCISGKSTVKTVSSLLITVFILFTFGIGVFASSASDYTDIVRDAWYYESVKKAMDKGILLGTGNGLFSPGEKMTRAEVLTALWRMDDKTEPDGEGYFFDIPAGSDAWYVKAINYCYEKGIIKGINSDGNIFAYPNNPVTRAELITMLLNYYRLGGYDIYNLDTEINSVDCIYRFNDKDDIPEWCYRDIIWAVSCGMISGKTDISEDYSHINLSVRSYLTRAEFCVFLKRASDIVSEGENGHIHLFTDTVFIISSTCSTEGSQILKCYGCGETATYLLPKRDHNYEIMTDTNSTCTVHGRKVVVCFDCGKTKTTEFPLTAHSFIFSCTVNRSHSHPGYDVYICSLCGAVENRNIKSAYPTGKGSDINGDGVITYDEFFGVFDIDEYLENNGSVYLGVPYQSITDNINNPSAYLFPGGEGYMNCTSFITSVIRNMGGDISSVYSINAGWYANGNNLFRTLYYNSGYKYFDSISNALNSGFLQKGDLIYYASGSDCHWAIFWGEKSSDNLQWHSSPVEGKNVISFMTGAHGIDDYSGIYIFYKQRNPS